MARHGSRPQWEGKIGLIRPDGSGDHAAFPNVPGGEQLHADWSPDGKRIAFSIQGTDTEEIWAGDVDGSNTAKLVECVAPCVWVDEGAWSPDGRSYIYHRMIDRDGVGVSTLEILDLATNKTRVVLTAPEDRAFYQPRWSPDSSKVVTEYVKKTGSAVDSDITGVALAIVDVTEAKPVAREITKASELTNSPDWSCDDRPDRVRATELGGRLRRPERPRDDASRRDGAEDGDLRRTARRPDPAACLVAGRVADHLRGHGLHPEDDRGRRIRPGARRRDRPTGGFPPAIPPDPLSPPDRNWDTWMVESI